MFRTKAITVIQEHTKIYTEVRALGMSSTGVGDTESSAKAKAVANLVKKINRRKDSNKYSGQAEVTSDGGKIVLPEHI